MRAVAQNQARKQVEIVILGLILMAVVALAAKLIAPSQNYDAAVSTGRSEISSPEIGN